MSGGLFYQSKSRQSRSGGPGKGQGPLQRQGACTPSTGAACLLATPVPPACARERAPRGVRRHSCNGQYVCIQYSTRRSRPPLSDWTQGVPPAGWPIHPPAGGGGCGGRPPRGGPRMDASGGKSSGRHGGCASPRLGRQAVGRPAGCSQTPRRAVWAGPPSWPVAWLGSDQPAKSRLRGRGVIFCPTPRAHDRLPPPVIIGHGHGAPPTCRHVDLCGVAARGARLEGGARGAARRCTRREPEETLRRAAPSSRPATATGTVPRLPFARPPALHVANGGGRAPREAPRSPRRRWAVVVNDFLVPTTPPALPLGETGGGGAEGQGAKTSRAAWSPLLPPGPRLPVPSPPTPPRPKPLRRPDGHTRWEPRQPAATPSFLDHSL